MNDRQRELSTELVISEILRWGVRCSLFLIVLGTVLCFVRGVDYGSSGGTADDLYSLINGEGSFPHSIAWLANGLLHLQGAAIIVAGLGLLISTPLMRVTASIAAFTLHKDRAFALISVIVFTLVILSFAIGAA